MEQSKNSTNSDNLNKETKWEKIIINHSLYEKEEEYKFEIGCNIIPHEDGAICINRNFEFENSINFQNSQNSGNSNLFRIDKLNFTQKRAKKLFNKKEGPRFRITNVSNDKNKI
jgi:hypothetical protein